MQALNYHWNRSLIHKRISSPSFTLTYTVACLKSFISCLKASAQTWPLVLTYTGLLVFSILLGLALLPSIFVSHSPVSPNRTNRTLPPAHILDCLLYLHGHRSLPSYPCIFPALLRKFLSWYPYMLWFCSILFSMEQLEFCFNGSVLLMYPSVWCLLMASHCSEDEEHNP